MPRGSQLSSGALQGHISTQLLLPRFCHRKTQDSTPLWMGRHGGLELIRAFPIFTVVLAGSEEQEVTGQPSRLPSWGDRDGPLAYPVL